MSSEVKTAETLKDVPALLFEPEDPSKVDYYLDNPNEPIPTKVATPSGASLNSLLPEGSKIYLCQNIDAEIIAQSDLRFRDSAIFGIENVSILINDLAESEDFSGLDQENLQALGNLLFKVALVRRGMGVSFPGQKEKALNTRRPREGDKELASILPNRDYSQEYVDLVNKYLGAFSTGVAEALAIAEELKLGIAENIPGKIDLLDRLKAHYNSQLADAFRNAVSNLAELETRARAPDKNKTVRVFNPRVGKYVNLPWNYQVLHGISKSAIQEFQADSKAEPTVALNNNEPSDESDAVIKRRLTHIYEARFPEEPLTLVIEETGNMVHFGGKLLGEEIVITTSDGSTKLNDFLPAGQTILNWQNSTTHYGYIHNQQENIGHVVIDLDYAEDTNISNHRLVCLVAHEIGHAYDKPQSESLTQKIESLSPKEKTLLNDMLENPEKSEPISRKIMMLGIEIINEQLQNEPSAWNEGKLVATACGVNDESYEQTQVECLSSYYFNNMYTISQLLRRCYDVFDNDEVDIFNPHSMEMERKSVAEIRILVNSIEFQSKARTAFSTANSIHGL